MYIKETNIKVTNEEANIRLDKYIASKYNYISRSLITKLIKEGNILLNDKKTKPSEKLTAGDSVYISEYNDEINLEEMKFTFNLEDFIVYEDKYLLVLNKPKGLIVHSGNNTKETLSLLLKLKYDNLPGEEGREGIVHRLDKNTSGLIIVAKTIEAYTKLKEIFKKREITKKYRAIVHGVITENSGKIIMPIARDKVNRHKMKIDLEGKNAETYFSVISRFNKYTYLDLQIMTGRTHQIRVHMNAIHHPILGEDIYSNRENDFGIEGQVLQAYYLKFKHPITSKVMEFSLPEPEEFKIAINNISKEI